MLKSRADKVGYIKRRRSRGTSLKQKALKIPRAARDRGGIEVLLSQEDGSRGGGGKDNFIMDM